MIPGRVMRCNCENMRCVHMQDGRGCGKTVNAMSPQTPYVGAICESCARRMDPDFMYPPHGTARRERERERNPKLKCETQTDRMGLRALRAFRAWSGRSKTLSDEAVFEHGQWWITCGNGAIYAVEDASGAAAVDGFCFEEVSEATSGEVVNTGTCKHCGQDIVPESGTGDDPANVWLGDDHDSSCEDSDHGHCPEDDG